MQWLQTRLNEMETLSDIVLGVFTPGKLVGLSLDDCNQGQAVVLMYTAPTLHTLPITTITTTILLFTPPSSCFID